MRSALPKVLHRIGGRPLVGHVLDTADLDGAAGAGDLVLVDDDHLVRDARDRLGDLVALVAHDDESAAARSSGTCSTPRATSRRGTSSSSCATSATRSPRFGRAERMRVP
jgi:CMP-2-keto-3-deoxyoctulosonic acid synthetase